MLLPLLELLNDVSQYQVPVACVDLPTLMICAPEVAANVAAPGISESEFLKLPELMRPKQKIFDKTGGLHAAGLFDPQGKLIVVREDVGRHNAVDKVIGYALMNDLLPLDGYSLAISGRGGFEIIQKAIAARISAVVAVSAPTSLAVETAREFGLTLYGFTQGRFSD
jgi:FdhD protein